MKNIVFLLLALLSGCSGHAQTLSSNTYPMPSGKKATLKLPYARNIVVKAWDRPELQFNMTIQTTSEEIKKIHTVDIQDSKDELKITTDFKKDFNWEKTSCCWCDACDSLLKAGSSGGESSGIQGKCICFRVDYEILLPANAALSLETISGDIEVKGHTGDLTAKTISGFVDIGRKGSAPADLEFHSVTGEIYTDFDIALEKNSSAYDKKVQTQLNGGGSDIKAETVSGDIYFRKQ